MKAEKGTFIVYCTSGRVEYYHYTRKFSSVSQCECVCVCVTWPKWKMGVVGAFTERRNEVICGKLGKFDEHVPDTKKCGSVRIVQSEMSFLLSEVMSCALLSLLYYFFQALPPKYPCGPPPPIISLKAPTLLASKSL